MPSARVDGGADARAENATGACAGVWDRNNAAIVDPTLSHLIVDGVHVNLLLPPDYQLGDRRYPTVYLFRGAFGDEDSLGGRSHRAAAGFSGGGLAAVVFAARHPAQRR
jgi:hypothetical protein